MNTDLPILETARLRLYPYRHADFDGYAAMWADPAVVRFITGTPFTREQSWGRFLRLAGHWQFLGFGTFRIEDKATSAFVGECGFHDLKRELVPSLEGTMEGGWALNAAYHGQGLATEAMRAVLGWADQVHPNLRQTCLIDTTNAGSQRVAAKLGFTEFARADYLGKPVLLLERIRQPKPSQI